MIKRRIFTIVIASLTAALVASPAYAMKQATQVPQTQNRAPAFSYEIRPLKNEDIPAMEEIHQAIVDEGLGEFSGNGNAIVDYSAVPPQFFEETNDEEIGFKILTSGAFVEGKLVGYVTAGKPTRELQRTTMQTRNRWFYAKRQYLLSTWTITGIDLLGKYRKRGIARALMKNVLDKMGSELVWLSVHPENKDAIKLYRNSGFRELAGKDFATEGITVMAYPDVPGGWTVKPRV